VNLQEIQDRLEALVPNALELLAEPKHKRHIFGVPTLLLTDASCVLERKAYPKTPVLVDVYGDVIVAPTHWIRILALSVSIETLHQYAVTLTAFWGYLRRNRRPWTEVDDAILIRWKNEMRNGSEYVEGIKEQSVNSNLRVVLQYLKWAQEYGYISRRIGLTIDGEAPRPIRLVLKQKSKRKYEVWPHMFRIQRRPRAPVPTAEQVDELYVHLSGPTPAKHRNQLIASWSLGSGLRRGEIQSLRITMLPSVKECLDLKALDRVYWMKIRGKGGKERNVPVDPDLLLETRAFSFGSKEHPSSREKMVMRRSRPIKDDSIFLNANTGRALLGQSMSHIFRDAFAKSTGRADRLGLRLHRLRARFASKLVQELAIAAVERGQHMGEHSVQNNVLENAADILGHSDVKTLRAYLNAYLDQGASPVRRAISTSRRV